MDESNKIDIYLSSKCVPNPGMGAWAYIMTKDGVIFNKKSYLIPKQTNTQMDLAAAILALESLIKVNDHIGHEITVYSCSQYLVKGVNEWLSGWKANGLSGIKNPKHWTRLDKAIGKCAVEFIWTSWSARNKYSQMASDMCDKMYAEQRHFMDSLK